MHVRVCIFVRIGWYGRTKCGRKCDNIIPPTRQHTSRTTCAYDACVLACTITTTHARAGWRSEKNMKHSRHATTATMGTPLLDDENITTRTHTNDR